MADKKVNADNFVDTIQKDLTIFSETVQENIKKIVETVSKEAAAELRADSPRRSGKYARGWTAKIESTNSRDRVGTIHNRNMYYLAHLIENGHAKRGGGRTSPQAHIKQVEQRAIKKLEDGIEEAAGRAT